MRTSHLKRSLGSGLAALALATGLTVAAAGSAQAASQLGGVSVANACYYQLVGNTAVVVKNNVYGWRCRYQGAVISVTYWYGPDLNVECAREYGSGAYSGYLDYNNPYSWRCFR